MANDRLYLYHRETNKAVLLAKSYGVSWIEWSNPGALERFFTELSEWLSEDQPLELVRESDCEGNFPTCWNIVGAPEEKAMCCHRWALVPLSDPTKPRPQSPPWFYEYAIVGPEDEVPRIPVKHKATGDLIVACVNAVRAAAKRRGMDPVKFAELLESSEKEAQ